MGDLLRAMEGPTSPAEIPANWAHLPFFSERFQAIEAQVTADPREILPPSHQRFAALEACAGLEKLNAERLRTWDRDFLLDSGERAQKALEI